jgi:hypothetical protein
MWSRRSPVYVVTAVSCLCGHGGLSAAGRADLEHVGVHAQIEGEDLLHLRDTIQTGACATRFKQAPVLHASRIQRMRDRPECLASIMHSTSRVLCGSSCSLETAVPRQVEDVTRERGEDVTRERGEDVTRERGEDVTRERGEDVTRESTRGSHSREELPR